LMSEVLFYNTLISQNFFAGTECTPIEKDIR